MTSAREPKLFIQDKNLILNIFIRYIISWHCFIFKRHKVFLIFKDYLLIITSFIFD